MKHLLLLLVCSSILSVTQAQIRVWDFDFGVGKEIPRLISVVTTDQYSDQKGYGFESTDGLVAVNRNAKSRHYATDFITSNKPFYFSVKLPEGNYKVHVILGDTEGSSVSTIRVESRRLMANHIVTHQGQTQRISFVVHVRDSINRATNTIVALKPREKTNFHWDNKLTFEFNDSNAKVDAIFITKDEEVPTLFLAGNSTVVDQPDEPWASWGQMFPSFFKPGTVAVANYAESGETLKAFEHEGRLDKIWAMSKPGDYLFMEFAHNDQKPGPNHLDPYTSYQETLTKWITLARSKGIHPVLVTSTNRRTFDSTGHVYNSLGDYPEAMRALAIRLQVPLIDLNAMSKTFYEALGPVASTKAFVYFKANAYPNQTKDVKDDTHFNTYGAYQLAKCVAKGIHENIPALSTYLLDALKNYNPTLPDNPDTFHLPEGLYVAMLKPDGN